MYFFGMFQPFLVGTPFSQKSSDYTTLIYLRDAALGDGNEKGPGNYAVIRRPITAKTTNPATIPAHCEGSGTAVLLTVIERSSI